MFKHLMCMDDSKESAGNEKKRIENLNTGSEDLQSGYRDGIWHEKVCHATNEKRKNDKWRKE